MFQFIIIQVILTPFLQISMIEYFPHSWNNKILSNMVINWLLHISHTHMPHIYMSHIRVFLAQSYTRAQNVPQIITQIPVFGAQIIAYRNFSVALHICHIRVLHIHICHICICHIHFSPQMFHRYEHKYLLFCIKFAVILLSIYHIWHRYKLNAHPYFHCHLCICDIFIYHIRIYHIYISHIHLVLWIYKWWFSCQHISHIRGDNSHIIY